VGGVVSGGVAWGGVGGGWTDLKGVEWVFLGGLGPCHQGPCLATSLGWTAVAHCSHYSNQCGRCSHQPCRAHINLEACPITSPPPHLPTSAHATTSYSSPLALSRPRQRPPV